MLRDGNTQSIQERGGRFYMKKHLKNFLTTLLVVVTLICAILPLSVSAKQGTMGTETPAIKASFVNSTGDTVDGNALTAGTYTVNIKLYGMKTVSIFDFIAYYTDDIVISKASTISSNNSQFVDGAVTNEKTDDGRNKLVAILTSNNEDCTAVSNGETMVTLTVTVVADNAVDFADCFKVNSDPNCTFVEADFGDGFEKAYVLVGNEATDDIYPVMTEDMSPELTDASYSVKGRAVIATQADGSEGTFGLAGITVSISGTDITATTDSDGYYTLSNVPEGTFTLSFAGATTVDRVVALTVSADKADENQNISVADVPVVMCDYNKDGSVNSSDLNKFMTYMQGDYYLYADFNADSAINSSDLNTFMVIFGNDVDYVNVEL